MKGSRTYGLRKAVATKLDFSAGLFHAFAMPRGATSCSATVQLLPDVMRR